MCYPTECFLHQITHLIEPHALRGGHQCHGKLISSRSTTSSEAVPVTQNINIAIGRSARRRVVPVRASVPRKPRAAKARLCCPIFPRTRLRSRIPKRGPSSIPRGSVAAPPVPPASAAKPLPSSVVPLAFPRKSAMSAPRSWKRVGSRQPIAVAPRPRRAPRPRPAARSRSSSAGKHPRATIPRAQPCTKGRWAQASVVPSACRPMRLRRRATAAVRAFPKTPLWAPWAPARS